MNQAFVVKIPNRKEDIIMSVYALYFSPTYSTETIVKIVATEFGAYKEIDLSKRENIENPSFNKEDICIIGVPSYGGRVPAIALERMKNIKGNNAKAVLVVSYGNRHYDDTVRELADFAVSKEFCCVAAITAIAEHSIMHQFAAGRPDAKDQEELRKFAKKILDKITHLESCKELELLGNYPYREYNGVSFKPEVQKECAGCGICAKECPTGAISVMEPEKTNIEKCISCMRCIKVCPNKARKLNPVMLEAVSSKMKEVCEKTKNNELFL